MLPRDVDALGNTDYLSISRDACFVLCVICILWFRCILVFCCISFCFVCVPSVL